MPHNNTSESSATTVLVALLLAVIVGFGVYFLVAQNSPDTNNDGSTDIDVTIPDTPSGDGDTSGSNGGSTDN